MQDLIVCQGKQRFRDADEAKRVARAAARRKESHPTAYRCPVCQGWHIGESLKKRKEKR